MVDKDVALAALSALCNADVTSTQKLRAQVGAARAGSAVGSARQQLSTNTLVSSVLDADDTCPVSRSSFVRLQSHLAGQGLSSLFLFPGLTALSQVFAALSRVFVAPPPDRAIILPVTSMCRVRPPTGPSLIIDEDEFFDPGFDYDFTGLKDTVTYYRGEEVYERPCGWKRFAIKVLDEYSDGNAWLGNPGRSIKSVPGEWPVSYHGTSKTGAGCIIKGFYKPGDGDVYGRGVYSTPYIADALDYVKEFTHKGKEYNVILQNRINPQKRQKHNNGRYWLIPIDKDASEEEMKLIVQESIRPYGLLLKAI